MNLIAVKYEGRKFYRDRTALRNEWNTGDVKHVPERDAKTLLRFAEFVRAPETEVASTDTAVMAVAAHAKREEEERDQTEGILMTVETMDKDALEAYALKYETPLDKRKSVKTLRNQVVGLIEQFGAR